MSDQVEELIKEIAAKHGIAVGRDDPILILQTINFRLMQDSAAAQAAMLDTYKEELEAIASRWENNANTKAERIVNASLNASKEAMATLLHDGAVDAAAAIRKEVDAGVGRLQGSTRAAHGLVVWNVVAAFVTLLAAALAVWATFGH